MRHQTYIQNPLCVLTLTSNCHLTFGTFPSARLPSEDPGVESRRLEQRRPTQRCVERRKLRTLCHAGLYEELEANRKLSEMHTAVSADGVSLLKGGDVFVPVARRGDVMLTFPTSLALCCITPVCVCVCCCCRGYQSSVGRGEN